MKGQLTKRIIKASYIIFSCSAIFVFANCSQAQVVQPFLPANDITDRMLMPPLMPALSGQPEAPGDGLAAPPEIQGDSGGPTPPPSGRADTTGGSKDSTMPASGGPTYTQGQGGSSSGGSPQQTNGDPKSLNDGNGGADSLYEYEGPLPTVRKFARYLVILGVVCATIFMAMSATSIIMGNPHGGARVIASASGLMMLLCAYTVWKIVELNTFNGNSAGPAQITYQSPNQQSSGGGGGGSNQNPQGRQFPQRSGIPLMPLGASQIH